jgi:uncharacterized iron-regulated membrane protein
MTRSLRLLIRRVHMWLGLSLGLLFVLLGLTGSALVFYPEIDAALHPQVQLEAAGPAPAWNSAVWDAALQTGRAHRPDPHGTWSLEATGAPGAIPGRYYPSGHHGHHAEREMVWFSPDGSQIIRSQPWGGYLMSWIYELHMHLLAGETGALVVGWSGLVLLLFLITGIVAWWPRGSWRKAFAFKRHSAPIRRLRDLHKLTGLWSFILLFLFVGTGALLALPDVRTQLLTATLGSPTPVPAPLSSASSGRQVSIAQALTAAHRALPDARVTFIDVPGTGAEPFRIRAQVPGDPHGRFPSSYVFVDQYSGRVLAIHDTRQGNRATQVNQWVRALHDGSVAGLATRILAVAMGLVPAALFVTGLLHWRRRRRSRGTRHYQGAALSRSLS